MALDLEKKLNEAFLDEDFERAVDLYSQALDLDPKSPDLLADRAQANIKLGNFTEAVADANKAIEFDPSMVKAYLRKGSACIKLEEYQTAKSALEAGFTLSPSDSRFTKLIKECDERLAEENNNLPKEAASVALPAAEPPVDELSNGAKNSVLKPKYRHDFYNAPSEVVLTIFAKNVPTNLVHVDFGEQILCVSIDIPGEEAYHFQPRLSAKIIPEKCRYTVLPAKIEVRLSKAEPITWTSLEYSKDRTAPQKVISSGLKSQRPSYPSSKTKTDWDKLEAEVKNEEKDEKLEGDAALNKLFRDIYRNADEDMRRAMSKSFVESNGTVLSTNWKNVGSKKVEGTPPEGMELKKWEY